MAAPSGRSRSSPCRRSPATRRPDISVQATRHDWDLSEITALFELPFNDLLFRAQSVHRAHFDPNEVQVSTLLSIKTGACAEDCAYCSQSARHDTGLGRERLLPLDEGRCVYGERAVQDWDWPTLRARIGYVPQEIRPG